MQRYSFLWQVCMWHLLLFARITTKSFKFSLKGLSNKNCSPVFEEVTFSRSHKKRTFKGQVYFLVQGYAWKLFRELRDQSLDNLLEIFQSYAKFVNKKKCFGVAHKLFKKVSTFCLLVSSQQLEEKKNAVEKFVSFLSFSDVIIVNIDCRDRLRWPNTVFARALAAAIQRAHKDCKNNYAVDTAIILLAQRPLYLCYFFRNKTQCVDGFSLYNTGMLEKVTTQRTQLFSDLSSKEPVKSSACAVARKIETDCFYRNLPISNDPVVRIWRNLAKN